MNKHLVHGLFLLLAVSSVTIAKDWRGIIPLHSTLKDVESLMGKPAPFSNYSYKTEEGLVMFNYQSDPEATCGKGYMPYDVPFGTILFIQIESKPKPLLAELKFDMSKFEFFPTCIGAMGYLNKEEGISMHVYDGRVTTLQYAPTPSDAQRFACPGGVK